MNSMTGYGRGTARHENWEITVEASSVNRKSLEITTSLPREWQGMDRAATDAVREVVQRGKVNVLVSVKNPHATAGVAWDDAAVSEVLKRLEALAKLNGVPFQPDARLLLEIVSAMGATGGLPGWDDAWPVVQGALSEALGQLAAMRAEEGAALGRDTVSRLDFLGKLVVEIRAQSSGTVPRYRELLLQRLRQAELQIDLSDERVLREVALFADRCDVAEELTRLESHLEQFRQTVSEKGSVGRKMDFLCQEIHREFNTIGSKANNLEITKRVIEAKNELERVREQIQNIE